MTYLNPNAIIEGENFILRPEEPSLEEALKSRCIHRFGPWRPFARGGRRWCLDCKGAEIHTPHRHAWERGTSHAAVFHPSGAEHYAPLSAFDPLEKDPPNYLPVRWGGDKC